MHEVMIYRILIGKVGAGIIIQEISLDYVDVIISLLIVLLLVKLIH